MHRDMVLYMCVCVCVRACVCVHEQDAWLQVIYRYGCVNGLAKLSL